jgi:hypothetical protein
MKLPADLRAKGILESPTNQETMMTPWVPKLQLQSSYIIVLQGDNSVGRIGHGAWGLDSHGRGYIIVQNIGY